MHSKYAVTEMHIDESIRRQPPPREMSDTEQTLCRSLCQTNFSKMLQVSIYLRKGQMFVAV